MATLLENYAKKLAISESVYANAHSGAKLSDTKKIAIATVLDNTSKFLNEAFTNSVGTQRADMGLFKRFCLNLTTVTMPNLIASDLVIVHPMTSMAGYIAYVQYVKGTNKGESKQGDLIADPFKLGKVDANYTAARVVETFKGDATTKDFTVAWTPVFDKKDANGKYVELKVFVNGVQEADDDITVDSATGKITLKNAPGTDVEVRIAYVYDNIVIPQNDLPILNAQMTSMPLLAKARRIAVYYSQIAAFQAKQDYGFDLGDQLAEKAVAELAYEIDTEITNLLIENADADTTLRWNKALPTGVSKAEHYAGFGEIVEDAAKVIYKRTQKHMPTYMLISPEIKPVLKFVPGFTAASVTTVNGPYYAGTLDGLKVFVTPNIEDNKFVLGVNGNDMMTSAAVYAPYMAIVPTQLLQYADGGTSQGFSTMYDLKILNKDLLVKGEIYTDVTEIVSNVVGSREVAKGDNGQV